MGREIAEFYWKFRNQISIRSTISNFDIDDLTQAFPFRKVPYSLGD